jgi:hypothetical protein
MFEVPIGNYAGKKKLSSQDSNLQPSDTHQQPKL